MLPKSNLHKLTNGTLINLALIESIEMTADEGYTEVKVTTHRYLRELESETTRRNHFAYSRQFSIFNVGPKQLRSEIAATVKDANSFGYIFLYLESTNQEHKLFNADNIVSITEGLSANSFDVYTYDNRRLTYIQDLAEGETIYEVIESLWQDYLTYKSGQTPADAYPLGDNQTVSEVWESKPTSPAITK